MKKIRVIAGKLKNRSITTKGIIGVRPIIERRREAMFNILGSLKGHIFADCCAGTGIVGIESVSRGAEFVYFIEKNFHNADILNNNLLNLNITNSRILRKDVLYSFDSFDKNIFPTIFYFAPPYKEKLLYLSFMSMFNKYPLLKNTILIIDKPFNLELNINLTNLILDESRKYGNSSLDFYSIPS